MHLQQLKGMPLKVTKYNNTPRVERIMLTAIVLLRAICSDVKLSFYAKAWGVVNTHDVVRKEWGT